MRQMNPAVMIVDFTPINSIDVSPRTVQGLARSNPAFPPSRPKLIVAPSDHLYGMSRMYQLIGEQIRPGLQVVRSMAEAYAALGLAQLHFGPCRKVDAPQLKEAGQLQGQRPSAIATRTAFAIISRYGQGICLRHLRPTRARLHLQQILLALPERL